VKITFSGFVLATAMVTGCASGPAFNDAKASFTQVPTGSGRIFFYRSSSLGAAVQPKVMLNGEKVGSAVPDGFFFVDRPPGDYDVSTSTEIKKDLTFHLDANQTRYVRLGVSMGLFAAHIYPELIDASVAIPEIEKTKSDSK
jgi:hypothetical protein